MVWDFNWKSSTGVVEIDLAKLRMKPLSIASSDDGICITEQVKVVSRQCWYEAFPFSATFDIHSNTFWRQKLCFIFCGRFLVIEL